MAQARALHPLLQTGVFAADMQVHLINDRPVTLNLRSTPESLSTG